MEAKKLVVPTILLAIGQFMPVAGIVGAWLLAWAARDTVLVAVMLTVVFAASALYIPSTALAVLAKLALWAILVLAILRIRRVYAEVSYAKNAYIEWGSRLLFAGALTYIVGVGVILVAAAFALIAAGLLSLPEK